MNDNQKMNELIRRLSAKLNSSNADFGSAVRAKDIEGALNSADADTKKRLEEILGDPEKTKRILESPEAKAIMNMLGGGK